MTTIYLHVGLHKTGTSAIQRILHKNEAWLLKRGIYYPTPDSLNAHHRLVNCLLDEHDNKTAKQEKFISKLEEYIIAAKEYRADLLISSEVFSEGIDDFFLRSYLNNKHGKIIIYIRRQDLLLESVYNQLLKQFGLVINDLVNTCFYQINTWEMLCWWEMIAGKGNVLVRLYDKSNAHQSYIIYDFLKVLGIDDFRDLILDEKVINQSIGLYETWLLEEIIPFFNGRHMEFMSSIRKRIHDNLPFEDVPMVGNYLTTQQRTQIINKVSAGNEKILKQFFPEHETLFSSIENEAGYPKNFTWTHLITNEYFRSNYKDSI